MRWANRNAVRIMDKWDERRNGVLLRLVAILGAVATLLKLAFVPSGLTALAVSVGLISVSFPAKLAMVLGVIAALGVVAVQVRALIFERRRRRALMAMSSVRGLPSE